MSPGRPAALPPYRHISQKRGHDPASAMAAYPINAILEALDLIRSGRIARRVEILETVPQKIYDSMAPARPARPA